MGKIHALHSHSRERQSIPSGPREKPKGKKIILANQINMAVSVSCFLFAYFYIAHHFLMFDQNLLVWWENLNENIWKNPQKTGNIEDMHTFIFRNSQFLLYWGLNFFFKVLIYCSNYGLCRMKCILKHYTVTVIATNHSEHHHWQIVNILYLIEK